MRIIINNFTGDTINYLNGLVSIPSEGTLQVSNIYWRDIINDPLFIKDIKKNNIELSDGETIYSPDKIEEFYKKINDFLLLESIETINTKVSTNTNGIIINQALTTTTAFSITVPNNAVGFILEAPSDNTNNIRWCIGNIASTTIGMLLEPGRDTGYIPCSANISVCATVSGSNYISVQWILRL